jgi:RNA polymerase sigma-70 factor (ECF subfamily)
VAAGDDPQSLLRELVEELPEKFRRCLLLYYYEEQSVEQVAAMLAIPEGTVKTNLHRARAMLGQRLKALGLDDAQLWLEDGT